MYGLEDDLTLGLRRSEGIERGREAPIYRMRGATEKA